MQYRIVSPYDANPARLRIVAKRNKLSTPKYVTYSSLFSAILLGVFFVAEKMM